MKEVIGFTIIGLLAIISRQLYVISKKLPCTPPPPVDNKEAKTVDIVLDLDKK